MELWGGKFLSIFLWEKIPYNGPEVSTRLGLRSAGLPDVHFVRDYCPRCGELVRVRLEGTSASFRCSSGHQWEQHGIELKAREVG